MNGSLKWNPWVSLSLGVIIGLLLVIFSVVQKTGEIDSVELMMWLFGPALFLLTTWIRNRN